jgi:hypothetical protein
MVYIWYSGSGKSDPNPIQIREKNILIFKYLSACFHAIRAAKIRAT